MSATPSPGRTVSAGAVINNFVYDERDRFDEQQGNILAAAAQQVAELVGYLEVTADEYETACRVFLDVSERRYGEIDQDLGAENREPTAEELALLDELGLASLKVYLRIETFYVFAKILLDKLARLIPHYFGPARGVRIGGHSSLVDGVLPKFAAGKNLTPVPPPLVALISDLGSRVSAYRDRSITHAYSPRTYRGTAYSLDTGEAKIYTYRLYPRDASEMVGRHSETPRTLLPLIESYVHELVDYFERNRDKADPITRAQG